jgi:hypothetical protein
MAERVAAQYNLTGYCSEVVCELDRQRRVLQQLQERSTAQGLQPLPSAASTPAGPARAGSAASPAASLVEVRGSVGVSTSSAVTPSAAARGKIGVGRAETGSDDNRVPLSTQRAYSATRAAIAELVIRYSSAAM